MALGKQEFDVLYQMVRSEGWAEFQRLLNERITEKLQKLRNVRRAGISYDKTCGILDGMEFARDLVKSEMDEYLRAAEDAQEPDDKFKE